jgi:tRNA 2-thiouridine synthesizing protein A
MAEKKIVDARGLSCPQPVLLTKQALRQAAGGVVEVLVDTVTSRDNCTRAAQKEGWKVQVEAQPTGGFKLVLTK